jgi:hypothetical protein
MKSYDKVSSLRGVNTLLQGQQINGQTHRRENTEDKSQKADKSSRSKERPTQIRPAQRKSKARAEEPGPLRDATSEGQSTL